MTTCTRRSFLATLGTGLAAAPGLLRAQSRSARYPIAFSTLGCPGWSWKTILENADKLGYAALELRGIAGEMDLPKVPEFTGSRLAEAKRDLAALGIVVSDLGASARMHEKDPAVRAQQFDEGRRFIDLAQAMGVKYVRMFGDKIPEGEPKDEVMKRVVEGFRSDGRLREAGGRHGADRIARRLHALGGPREHPDQRRVAAVRPALGRAPLVCRRRGTARRHLREDRQVDPAHAPEGLEARGRRPALRAARHGRGAGEGAGQRAGRGRLQGPLLLRVGEEVAPGNRGAGGRVPALREDDGRVPLGRGREGVMQERIMSMDDKVSRREFLEKSGMAVGAVAAMPALLARRARPKPPR